MTLVCKDLWKEGGGGGYEIYSGVLGSLYLSVPSEERQVDRTQKKRFPIVPQKECSSSYLPLDGGFGPPSPKILKGPLSSFWGVHRSVWERRVH